MYKARIRFSGLSSEVFSYTTHLRSINYSESLRNLYKDMSSLARFIRRNKSKYHIPEDVKITFRLYTENWETIGDRFYF